ncbi:MAG: nuclear transport factor 2 family protein [Ilumatobacteraceae bacterium]
MTVQDGTRRVAIEHALAHLVAGDSDGAHAIYHDDAVLEFPQSGERFEGLANFKEWREQYPSDVRFDVRRISGSGDVWVRELTVSYADGPPMLGIAVLEFQGDRVATERIYVTERWEAPAWRAPWRSATTSI